MKKGILASVLAIALLGGIAYADTTHSGTHAAGHVAAMHKMTASGKMMYDSDCPGMNGSKRGQAQDRQSSGTVAEDKLAEFEQEIIR